MFGLSAAVRVYLAKEPADMRKSFDGLSALVAGALELDPLSGHLFVFLNKRRDRVKVLYWDRDGLAVWAKRLERGTFRIPHATAGRVEMTTAEARGAPGRHRPGHGPAAAPLHPARHAPPKFGELCANKGSRVDVVGGMISPSDPLPDDLVTAHQLIRELLATLSQQVHLNAKLQHQLEQLLRQRYGRKGERVDPAQLLLFAREILAQAEPPPEPAPEPTPPASAPAPKTRGHGRKPLPARLPRKPVVHDVPPEQLPCPDCGTIRRCIGREVREQLEYVPASLIVLEHVRPRYACPDCAAHVVIAERLPEPIEKGLPGPGLMAHVITSKYADHLPLYRQEGILLRQGVEISRSTMCDWMAAAAGLLSPIVKLMLAKILASQVVQNDDTTVKVQDHDGKGIKTGRLWASIGDHNNPHVVYTYTPDRSGAGPAAIFKGFRGYLQADAYSAYDGLYASGAIVEVGCLMHARRKFYEARTSDPPRAHRALAWVKLLYDIEREAKQEHEAEGYEAFVAARHALRQERSRPIFEQFRGWLEAEAPKVLPKSPIGEAIGYARNHWAALERPLEAGFLELDNGACERALKPVALGRKNWLFAGSDRGGETAAVLMSLCTTCKERGVDPQAYLRDVLDRISTHPARRIEELLPDRWQALRRAGEPAKD